MTTDPKVVPLSRFRAALARPQGARRVDELISSPNAAEAIAALSVPELYGLVADLGFADALQLIELATPEQIRGCVDLDSWDRDRVQLDAIMPWLAAVVDAGFEKVGQVWETLDPELRALIVARSAMIYDHSMDEEAPEDSELPRITTPDTCFTIELTSDNEDDVRLVMRVIQDLYRADMALARHTIMCARSELTAELEEMSYRWRSGRMADLGYPDPLEALEVFRPLDPTSVQLDEASAAATMASPADRTDPDDRARAPGTLPARILEQAIGRAFLAQALDRIDNADDADRVEAALLILVNKVLSAARVSPGDQEALGIGAEHATSTLAVGLETVCRGDIDLAARALCEVSLIRLHRVGYTVTLRLARYARHIATRAQTAGEPTASVLPPLLASRPFFPCILDTEGSGDIRPFESLEDVRVVAQHLTELALRIAVADTLGVDLAAMAEHPEPRPELDDHVRTALVRAMATEGEFRASPLTPDELDRFRTRAMGSGTLTPQAREAAGAALTAHLDRAGITAGREFLPGLLEAWLTDLEATLGQLPVGEALDPRFVQGVVLSAGKA